MRRLAFLLHIYQPPTQHEDVLRRVAEQCYLPLIKTIKQKKFKITMDIPLGLLEQMDRYGYASWIDDIRELVHSEKLELVGSAAYHPLLTKIPVSFVEDQVILNEFALGYYFGKKGGFEGDASVMIKNLTGFFPPELAVNEELLGTLDELGYEWVLVDESSIPKRKSGLFEVGEHNIKVVARNNKLSKSLASKRDLDVNPLVSSIESSDPCVIALEGEVFGEYNERGILLFSNLIDALKEKRVEGVFVSDYIETTNEETLQNLTESTWNTSFEKVASGDLYPMWEAKGNKIHALQWEVLNKVLKTYKRTDSKSPLGFEELAVWNPSELEKIDDKELQDEVFLSLQVARSINSNQFWWASFKPIGTSSLILRGVDLLEEVAHLIDTAALTKYVSPRLEKIKTMTEEQKA